jgi:hypothetical protein
MNATLMCRYINFVADCLLDIDKMYNVTSPFDFPDMIGQNKFLWVSDYSKAHINHSSTPKESDSSHKAL